jgi:hypothetical protein
MEALRRLKIHDMQSLVRPGFLNTSESRGVGSQMEFLRRFGNVQIHSCNILRNNEDGTEIQQTMRVSCKSCTNMKDTNLHTS